jgi:peptidoglycan/xylan/chitin deacetylase (PgdA/CDA1 family)
VSRPSATVSVDVDPVDLHLVGYGFPGLPPDPLVYTAALPRLLEAFARHGIRATLFMVGRDAAGRRVRCARRSRPATRSRAIVFASARHRLAR